LDRTACLRVQQGDWDDGVVVALADPIAIAFTVQRGESIPNSAMACVVLPRIAAAVKPLDAALWRSNSSPMRRRCRRCCASGRLSTGHIARMWAVDGLDRPLLVANGSIDLQAVVWPLLADDNVLLTRAEKIALVDRVSLELSSAIGPLLSPSNAQVWPAISQLFVAAVAVGSRACVSRGAAAACAHVGAACQRAFPRSWVGVLSGPDGFDAVSGGTWESAVTPMVDWPVQNANPDAMFVFTARRGDSACLPPNPALQSTPRGSISERFAVPLRVAAARRRGARQRHDWRCDSTRSTMAAWWSARDDGARRHGNECK
jgi:hypothetical protein